VLELKQVTAGYGRNAPALKSVSLTLQPGNVHAIVGANGAGKTTLLRLVLGLLSPGSGQVRVFGQDPLLSIAQFVHKTGILLDGRRRLEPRWTAEENLEYHALRLKLRPVAYRDRSRGLLDRFGLPAREPVNRFSRGMRQRLRLVIALLPSPCLVLLDEPTLGLDVEGQKVLMRIIDETRSAGGSVLLTSQSLDFLERVADEFTILRKGEAVAQGPLDAVARAIGQTLQVALSVAYPERIVDALPNEWELDAHGRIRVPLDPRAIAKVMELLVENEAGLLDLERPSPLEKSIGGEP